MRQILTFFILLFVSLPAIAEESPQVKAYAILAYKSYQAAYTDALGMQKSIAAYSESPTEANRAAAQTAWVKLRGSYAPTEAFRFYDGPADEVQPRLNQWPINTDFINNLLADVKFEIGSDTLLAKNQEFDETQVTTGLNVVEYFLWSRGVKNEREKQYLKVISELATADIKTLQDAWEPEKPNYAREFLHQDPKQSQGDIMLGIMVLSGFELASNRMENHDTIDDYSALSKNTTAEFLGALAGIHNVYFGTGINVLTGKVDKALAEKISGQMQRSEKLATAPLNDTAVRKALTDSLQIEAGLFKQAATKMNLVIENVAE